MRTLEHEDVRALSSQEWFDLLARSVDERRQGDLLFPAFPPEAVQEQYVGSSRRAALEEAAQFYSFVLQAFSQFERGRCRASRYLDFGCGWGRIGRFFLKEFESGDMAGVDIDPDVIEFCRGAALPGHYARIRSGGRLPFADASFRLVTAYSVFTHLPEHLYAAWTAELLRVTAPEGLIVFTVEPPRFLDFVQSIDPGAPPSGWHAALATFQPELPARRAELAERGFTYLPTGGGDHRGPDIYGDAVVTEGFVASQVRAGGTLRTFLDAPDRFWQAVVVVQRSATPVLRRLREAVR